MVYFLETYEALSLFLDCAPILFCKDVRFSVCLQYFVNKWTAGQKNVKSFIGMIPPLTFIKGLITPLSPIFKMSNLFSLF